MRSHNNIPTQLNKFKLSVLFEAIDLNKEYLGVFKQAFENMQGSEI